MEVIIVENYEELSKKAFEVVKNTLLEKSNAVLGLATGSSPVGLYKEMIKDYEKGNLDFSNVKSVNLDEYVGLDISHDQSYFKFMDDNLFSHININKKNTFLPSNSGDIEKNCTDYNDILNRLSIDLQILGIGQNGHIGFNEPGTSFDSTTHVVELDEQTRIDNARFFDSIDEVPTKAISMGIKNIMAAKKIIVLASGCSKQEAVFGLVKGPVTTNLPASVLQGHNNCILICDKEAAAKL